MLIKMKKFCQKIDVTANNVDNKSKVHYMSRASPEYNFFTNMQLLMALSKESFILVKSIFGDRSSFLDCRVEAARRIYLNYLTNV